jgi:hypothetical protein
MRLFLFHPDTCYDNADVSSFAKVSTASVRSETSLLTKIDFLKPRSFLKEIGDEKSTKKKRVNGWVLNKDFKYRKALHQLLINTDLLSSKSILKRLKNVGRLKLVLISGVFLQDMDSRVDLLIVGDGLKKGALDTAVKTLESEIGTEIRYTFFDTDQFMYRLGMYDKLVREILEYQHEKILNKLDL